MIDYRAIGLPKWPQMLVSGRPVTIPQAKEIIFRTDGFLTSFSSYAGGNDHAFNAAYRQMAGMEGLDGPGGWALQEKVREHLGYIHTEYVYNAWASSSFIYGGAGWCHPDGTIKFRHNVGKWPSVETIEDEWKLLAQAFPYLDLTVTLMSGEEVEEEEGTIPLVNIRVFGGGVELQEPDLAPHCAVLEEGPPDISLAFLTRNENALPTNWITEFAARVRAAIEEVK